MNNQSNDEVCYIFILNLVEGGRGSLERIMQVEREYFKRYF